MFSFVVCIILEPVCNPCIYSLKLIVKSLSIFTFTSLFRRIRYISFFKSVLELILPFTSLDKNFTSCFFYLLFIYHNREVRTREILQCFRQRNGRVRKCRTKTKRQQRLSTVRNKLLLPALIENSLGAVIYYRSYFLNTLLT